MGRRAGKRSQASAGTLTWLLACTPASVSTPAAPGCEDGRCIEIARDRALPHLCSPAREIGSVVGDIEPKHGQRQAPRPRGGSGPSRQLTGADHVTLLAGLASDLGRHGRRLLALARAAATRRADWPEVTAPLLTSSITAIGALSPLTCLDFDDMGVALPSRSAKNVRSGEQGKAPSVTSLSTSRRCATRLFGMRDQPPRTDAPAFGSGARKRTKTRQPSCHGMMTAKHLP